MMKLAATLLSLSALVGSGASAQAPPSLLQPSVKKELKAQVPPAPVVAPLCIGTAFNAFLDESLDTRKTKAGDLISAEVTEDVTYERSTIFPKGTKIVGHVVRVTSGGRGRAGSAIFLQFDKATLKDGQEVVLSAGIQALAVGAVAPLTPEMDAPKNNMETAPHAVPVEDNSGNSVDNSGLVMSATYEAPRNALRAPLGAAPVAEGEFTSDGLFTPESKGAFGRPDLKVYTPTSEGSHGTVLLSSKKSMHLEGGTRLLLVVQPPPSADSDAENSLDLDQIQ